MPIPFLSTPDKPLTASTQDLIPIADITDGIVFYKNGGAALVMESSSLNFGLLSEEEQEAIIASYAGLLNSFNFPVQIVVRSQKKDISSYLNFLSQKEKEIKNPLLKNLFENYKNFIQESVKKRNVLSKKFYIIVPFTPYELGIAKSLLSSLGQSSKKTTLIPYPKSYVVRKAKIALLPKRDHLIRQARRLNIKLRQLTDEELIGLFYNIFNPEPPVKEEGDYF